MGDLKISIITITFNSEKTVRETFESVRKQHYSNLEYIVIDGKSQDSTLKIAEDYEDIITRIVSEPDKGISDAMNKGIRLATGDLIGIIHSDDMLTDGALEKLSREWDGKTGVYFGNAIMASADGQLMHVLCARADTSNMPYSFTIVHPAAFVTRVAYDKVGLYDTSLKCVMDIEIMLRLYNAGIEFKYINDNLAVYRAGGTNMRYRRRTINESRDVAIKYGGGTIKANMVRLGKIAKDAVKLLLRGFHVHSNRVRPL